MACRHSGRHVYVALGCVFDYATIACTLRWGVALVVGPPFQVQVRCKRPTRIRDRTYEESLLMDLILYNMY